MGSLGFRYPHFSEAQAWLPPWLHQPKPDASESSCQPALEGNFSEQRHSDPLQEEEGHYRSCHLFLSGEDDSPSCSLEHNANMLHLRLCLSSESDVQHCSSQRTSRSQCESERFLSRHRVECSAGGLKKNYLIERQGTGEVVNYLSPVSITKSTENPAPCSLSKNKDRYLKTGIAEAIEFSVAASEALVIHDLFQSDLGLKSFPTEAVLEAALLIKKARLKGLQHTFYHPLDNVDDIDTLSDLDDLKMEDAFEDVGLYLNHPDDQFVCGSDVSVVKETPMSHNLQSYCNDFKHSQLLSQQQTEHPASGTKSSSSISVIDPIIDQLYRENPPAEQKVQEDNCAVMEVAADVSNAQNFSYNGEATVHTFVPDKLKSCFVSPHTLKVDSTSPKCLKPGNAKGILKPFLQETSFLSESADIAQDKYSFAQKYEVGHELDLRYSITSVNFVEKADDVLSISQEASSSNLSRFDPLSSVVPCSVSPEGNSSPPVLSQKIKDVDAGSCVGSALKDRMESLQKPSNIDAQLIRVDERTMPIIAVNCAESFVRRQLTSLKNYSKLMPDHIATSFLRKESSERFKTMMSIAECADGSDNKKNDDSIVFKSPCAAETSRVENKSDELAKGRVELLAPHETVVEQRNCKSHQKLQSEETSPFDIQVSVKKRVHFAEVDVELPSHSDYYTAEWSRRKKISISQPDFQVLGLRRCLATNEKHLRNLIFQGIEFLLTGLSRQKEKEIEGLIRRHGGTLLRDIPSPSLTSTKKRHLKSDCQHFPVVLCSKKLQTTKFLYGCAVSALILKIKWLTDSIAVGFLEAPKKYMVVSNHAILKYARIGKPIFHVMMNGIFDRVGIMLQGKICFCTRLAMVVKHGGGQVFKSLHRLVQSLDTEKISLGIIVAEDVSRVSRHLKQCAVERKISIMPFSWIVKCLYSGKLLPPKVNKHSSLSKSLVHQLPVSINWTQEI